MANPRGVGGGGPQSDRVPQVSDFVIPSKTKTAIKITAPSQSTGKASTPDSLVNATAFDNGASQSLTEPLLFVRPQKLGEPRYSDKASHTDALVAAGASDTQAQPNASFMPRDSQIRPVDSSLDIYANNYVPVWLTAINEAAVTPRHCCPLNTINYATYIASFAGNQFLSPVVQLSLPPIGNVPSRTSTTPKILLSNQYSEQFSESLRNEIAAESVDIKAFCM